MQDKEGARGSTLSSGTQLAGQLLDRNETKRRHRRRQRGRRLPLPACLSLSLRNPPTWGAKEIRPRSPELSRARAGLEVGCLNRSRRGLGTRPPNYRLSLLSRVKNLFLPPLLLFFFSFRSISSFALCLVPREIRDLYLIRPLDRGRFYSIPRMKRPCSDYLCFEGSDVDRLNRD